MKETDGALKRKSYSFAIRIVKLTQYLEHDYKEYVLSKQILKSGTSIGAIVSKAEFDESKLDFINKLKIALKEVDQTSYWLSLLYETDYIDEKLFESLQSDCKELIDILVSTVKTTKKNLLNVQEKQKT
ncbi:MAG: four helix bundle protein [Bacteroidales bacterium]|jgi:four helix bundle protein|nr:four helix bundle protein [Bacteroidales bacterium]